MPNAKEIGGEGSQRRAPGKAQEDFPGRHVVHALQWFMLKSFEQDEPVKSCQIQQRGGTVATARADSVVPRAEKRMASLSYAVGGNAS